MTGAERRTLIIAAVIALSSVIVLGLIAAAWATLPHQVTLTVDGGVVHVPAGSSVADLVEYGYVRGPRGDLLSVGGGVARVGAGGDPTVLRNGRLTSSRQPVYDGDVITSTRGADVVERTIDATSELPPATRYVGRGPLMTVTDPGTPGIVRSVRGAVSGSIVESEVVSPPRDSVVSRRTPRPSGKIVALTFDDGPWPRSTLKIVRTLQREGVPATFFMVGVTATKQKRLARQVADAGFTVGSHSFSHKPLQRMPKKVVDREVTLGARRVAEITGTKAKWFRSPYGLTSPTVLKEVRGENLQIAWWTVDPKDWTRPGVPTIVRNTVRATRPGSIILLHDGGGDRSQTVAALPYIIHALRKKGYTFVTLDELAAQSR